MASIYILTSVRACEFGFRKKRSLFCFMGLSIDFLILMCYTCKRIIDIEGNDMKYKLIACDLDGTLLNSSVELSSENKTAITELVKKGVIFVPATGRSFYETPASIREHPSIRYFISSNGSVIQDLKTGERFEFPVEGKKADKIHAKMRKCNLLLAQHKNNHSLVDASRLGEDIMDEYKIPHHFRKQLRECTVHLENLDAEFSRGEPCEMLSGCFKSTDQFNAFMNEISGIDGIHCTGAASGIVEIVSTCAGKHNAIKFLIEKLGISKDEVITVGDSRNDIEMIEFSPNSIAMANAIDELKEKAAHVGCTNDEHVAKYILENFA